jgi:hypothetical protein
MDTEKKVCI